MFMSAPGAIVLMGCSIGDHCVIAAGAIVPQYTVVPDWSLVVGVPGVDPRRAGAPVRRHHHDHDDPQPD